MTVLQGRQRAGGVLGTPVDKALTIAFVTQKRWLKERERPLGNQPTRAPPAWCKSAAQHPNDQDDDHDKNDGAETDIHELPLQGYACVPDLPKATTPPRPG